MTKEVNINQARLSWITAQIMERQRRLAPKDRFSDEQVKDLAWKVYTKEMPEEPRVTTSKVGKVETPDRTNVLVSMVSSRLKEKQKEKPIQDRFTDRDIEFSVRAILRCKDDSETGITILEVNGIDFGIFRKIKAEVYEMDLSVVAAALTKSCRYNDPSVDDATFANWILKNKIKVEMVKENQMDKPVEQRIPDEHLEMMRQQFLALETDRENGIAIWISENQERMNLELLKKIRVEMNALDKTSTYKVRLRAALVKRKKAAEGNNTEPPEPSEDFVIRAGVMRTMLKENQKRKEERDRFTDEQIESFIEMCYEKEKDKEHGMLMWEAAQKDDLIEIANRIIEEAKALRDTKAFEVRVTEVYQVTQDRVKSSEQVKAPEAVRTMPAETMIECYVLRLKEGQQKKPVKQRFTDVQIEKFGKFVLEWQTDKEKASAMVETKGSNRLDQETIQKLKDEMEVLRETVEAELYAMMGKAEEKKEEKEGEEKMSFKTMTSKAEEKEEEEKEGEEKMSFETMMRKAKGKEEEARQRKEKEHNVRLAREAKALERSEDFKRRALEAYRMTEAGKDYDLEEAVPTAILMTEEIMIAVFVGQLKEWQMKKPVKDRFTDVQIDKFGKYLLECTKDSEKALEMAEAKGRNRLDRETIHKLHEELDEVRKATVDAFEAEQEGKQMNEKVEETENEERMSLETTKMSKEEAKMGGEGNVDDVESVQQKKEKKEKVEKKKKRKKRSYDGMTEEERELAKLEAKMNRMLKQSMVTLRNPLCIIITFFTFAYSAIGFYSYCEWLVHLVW